MKKQYWKYSRGTYRQFDYDKVVSFLYSEYETLLEIDKASAKGKMSMLIMKFMDEVIVTMNDALAVIIQFDLFNDKLKDRHLSEEETINLYESIIDVVRSEMYYRVIESFEDINEILQWKI